MSKARDREFLDALTAAGLALDDGPDDTGWVRKFWTSSGYYIDVGCSRLIIDGTVGVIQHKQVDRFVPSGLQLRDGTVLPFDAVVMATGFQNQESVTRAIFGDDVADRVGATQGYDPQGEVRNIYRPTAQPGLWFGAGGIHHCRTFSPVLALQLKADLEGLVSPYEF